MKIPLQEKIAELESRIIALEAQAKKVTRTTTTVTTAATAPDLEPEMSRLWASFDALFKKVVPW